MPALCQQRRRGYSMVTVMIFLTVILTVMGISQRHIGSLLRLQQAELRADRADDGPLEALARAVELLESGLPPADPFVCAAQVPTADGPRVFKVTYREPRTDHWQIDVAPLESGENPPAMPLSFSDSYDP